MSVISGGEIEQRPTESFIETLISAFKAHATSIFLVEARTGKKYTFDDLRQVTYKYGATLVNALGIRPGQLVTIVGETSFESISFIIATILSGGTINPLDRDRSEDEISKMLEISRPSLIYCTDDANLSKLSQAIKRITIKPRVISAVDFHSYLVSDNEANNFEPPKINSEEHVGVVTFTSGTTGEPKAVKFRDQTILMYCLQVNTWEGKFERCILDLQLFWIININKALKAVVIGFTVVIPECNEAEGLLRAIQNHKATTCWVKLETLFDMCNVVKEKYELSSIKKLYFTSCPIKLKQKLMIRDTLVGGRNVLKILYGSSETMRVTEWPDEIDPDSPEYESVGKPIKGVQIKIKDLNNNTTLGPGEKGEICVQSVYLMAGYMNKDLPLKELDEDGYWHMGDIGYYDENGYLYYVARLNDVFKYHNTKIAPIELEEVLLKHPAVFEAAVVGKPHEADEKWPTAFVVAKSNVKTSAKEIEEFVAVRVSDYKKLRGGVHFLNAIPRNAAGKVVRSELLKHLK